MAHRCSPVSRRGEETRVWVLGTFFNQDEQRAVGESQAGQAEWKVTESADSWQSTGFYPVAIHIMLVSDVSDKKIKPQSPATLKLTSHCPCCYVKEHIICKPRTTAVESLFPRWPIPKWGGDRAGNPRGSGVTITLRANKTPPNSSVVLSYGSYGGQNWKIKEIKNLAIQRHLLENRKTSPEEAICHI